MQAKLLDQVARLHREAPLTDVHIHPSLKTYLFRRSFWKHYWSGKVWDPFASRSDHVMLARGGVGVIWVSHHLPEREIFQDCPLAKLAAAILVPGFPQKLLHGDRRQRLIAMIDACEREFRKRPDRIEVAHSAADIARIRAEGKIAAVHTVEGAHVLEGDPDNLYLLAERGVALLTLCHFYPNGLASHVDAIPHDMLVRRICKFDFGLDHMPPLTELGRAVLQKMKTLPMIVDLSHCNPAARAAIFAEMGTDRPLVASHAGVSRYNPDPYNLSDEEILQIARTGGAVGVTFITYWLDAQNPADGLPAIWNTIAHIRDVTNSWDHIVLASDFDGFTDPPDDVRDASWFGRVTALLLQRGVPEEDVKKILGGNAQRILATGWR